LAVYEVLSQLALENVPGYRSVDTVNAESSDQTAGVDG
jgi:hypothetical protein